MKVANGLCYCVCAQLTVSSIDNDVMSCELTLSLTECPLATDEHCLGMHSSKKVNGAVVMESDSAFKGIEIEGLVRF